MKKLVSVVAVAAILAVASLSFAATMMRGPISKIVKNSDGTYTVTVQDSASGKNVVLQISDSLTVNKLNDHRIVNGDDVKVKYEQKGGKNISEKFLKSAGC